MGLKKELGISSSQKLMRSCTQDFVPLKEIIGNTIVTTDGRYIKILEVMPVNFRLKSVAEQQMLINSYAALLKTIPPRFSIKCVTRQEDTDTYSKPFREYAETETSESCRTMLYSHIRHVSKIRYSRTIAHKFYFIFEYEDNEMYARRKTQEDILYDFDRIEFALISGLKGLGNKVVKPPQNAIETETARIIYNHYNRALLADEPFESRIRRIANDTARVNAGGPMPPVEWKTLLAPKSFSTDNNHEYTIINGMYCCHAFVKANGFPPEIEPIGWFSRLINLGYGIEVDLYFTRQDKAAALTEIDLKTRGNWLKLKDREESQSDYRKVLGSYHSLLYMSERLREYGDDKYDMNILLSIYARNKEELYAMKRYIRDFAITEGIDISFGKNLQEECFISAAPFNRVSPKLFKLSKHNVATEAVAAAYPFTSFSLNDEGGIFIGTEQMNHSSVIYNPFSSQYVNANMCVFGSSGTGKSYMLQLLTERLRLQGKQIFIISPDKQDEFRRICNALDGVFVDVSASASTRINPFDIWPTTSETDALLYDKTGEELSWMLQKVNDLELWASLLIKDLSQAEKVKIKNCFAKMYRDKGIEEDNDTIYKDKEAGILKDMPIYSDFVEVLKREDGIRPDIIEIFSQFTTGALKSLNGSTNVDLNNKYIVFGLENLRGELQAPMMFILLKFMWAMARADKTKKKAIVIDEGSLLVDGENPLVGKFVVEIFKLIRGYGGAAIFATQTIADLYKQGGEFGNVILSCSHSTILLGMPKTDIQLIQKALSISDLEAAAIQGYKAESKEDLQNQNDTPRGMAMLCAGTEHIPVHVVSSAQEYSLFTTKSNDLAKIAAEKRNRKQ